MIIWHDIDNDRITKEQFIACIEIPKGSKKKYELDYSSKILGLNKKIEILSKLIKEKDQEIISLKEKLQLLK